MTERPLTLLAFDYGARRIGIAVGQRPGPVTRGLTTVVGNGEPDWRTIEALIGEWQPQRLVVGLPYNMDGTPSAMTARARAFAAELERRCARPVELADERLSSRAAREALGAQRQSGQRRRIRREDIDREAARIIAEQWMAAHPDRQS